MTIATTAIVKQEVGDGADLTFSFDWKVFTTAQIIVYKIANNVSPNTKSLQTEGVDYTVALNSGTPGGIVTYTVAPTANEDSYIAVNISDEQLTSLKTAGKFRADSVEDMVDKIVQRVKEMQEELDRCLKVPRELSNPPALPDFAAVEGDLHYDGVSAITIV